MNKNIFKSVFLGLSALLMTSVAYAKCYPGLDCPTDLPGGTKKAPDEWQMIDHYLVKGGLVKDPATGLEWMRCSFGQNWDGSTCQGKTAEIKWEQAINIPKHFDYGGHNDWRIPTLDELKLLVYCSTEQMKTDSDGKTGCDGDYDKPTIFNAAFPQTPAVGFWTSSPNTDNDYSAWVVFFYYGYGDTGYKDDGYAVRLVRGGQ